MSNYLSPEKLQTLEGLFEHGHGIRAAARLLGISKSTSAKYYPHDRIIACACGAPATHQGWCSWRVGQSPERLAFLRRWAYRSSGLLVSVDHPAGLLQQAAVVLRPSNVEGESISHIDIINAVNKAVPSALETALREDLIQDMFVEVIEQRTPLSELGHQIKRRLSEIRGEVSRFKFVSLDAEIPGTNGLRMVDTIEADRFHF